MGSQQEAFSGAESELENLRTALNQLQTITVATVVDDFKVLADKGEKLSDIIFKLKNDLSTIAITNDGDKKFDNVGARVSTLRQALIDLRVSGILAMSEAYKDVTSQYLKAFDTTALNEL